MAPNTPVNNLSFWIPHCCRRGAQCRTIARNIRYLLIREACFTHTNDVAVVLITLDKGAASLRQRPGVL
jgi:hypothetical protein